MDPRLYRKARLADVCAILESQLETIEVDEWRAQMDEIAREPIRAYKRAECLLERPKYPDLDTNMRHRPLPKVSLAESLAWLSLSPVEKGIFSQLRGLTKAWLEEILQNARQ
ncbi:hypothetical protein ACTXT7_007415 [Hymenolepis weldensis]